MPCASHPPMKNMNAIAIVEHHDPLCWDGKNHLWKELSVILSPALGLWGGSRDAFEPCANPLEPSKLAHALGFISLISICCYLPTLVQVASFPRNDKYIQTYIKLSNHLDGECTDPVVLPRSWFPNQKNMMSVTFWSCYPFLSTLFLWVSIRISFGPMLGQRIPKLNPWHDPSYYSIEDSISHPKPSRQMVRLW